MEDAENLYIYTYMNQQIEYSSDIHFLMKQFLCGFIDKIWSSTRSPKFINWNVKSSFFVGYSSQ